MISRFVLGSVIAGIFTLQFYPLDGLGQEMGERLTRFTPEDMHAAPHFATSVIDRNTNTIHVSGQPGTSL
jgi:hypothetical protein